MFQYELEVVRAKITNHGFFFLSELYPSFTAEEKMSIPFPPQKCPEVR
jgi:hypothetical protein